jgi:hypothetical protein
MLGADDIKDDIKDEVIGGIFALFGPSINTEYNKYYDSKLRLLLKDMKNENKSYVKFLNNSLTHNGFKYQEGLNVDTIPFNPSGECAPGGLYYTHIAYLEVWCHMGELIADVEIPEDALVYSEPCGTKWKANKIILKNIRKWNNLKNSQKTFISESPGIRNIVLNNIRKNPDKILMLKYLIVYGSDHEVENMFRESVRTSKTYKNVKRPKMNCERFLNVLNPQIRERLLNDL